jgi:hypothetical protein
MRSAIAKQINGTRTYELESRSSGYETVPDTTQWIIDVINCIDCYSGIIQTDPTPSTGATYSTIANVDAVGTTQDHGVSDLYDEAVVDMQNWVFHNHKKVYEIHNTSVHDLDLMTYEFVAIRDFMNNPGANNTTTIQELVKEGLDKYTTRASGTTSTAIETSRVGNENYETASGGFTVHSSHLSPMSKWLGKWFKVIKRRRVRIKAGGTVRYTCRLKNFRFDPAKYNISLDADGEERIDWVKGISKFMIFSVRGPVGRDTAADGHATIGYMSVDWGMITTERAKILPLMGPIKRLRYMRTILDDHSATTLEGPTKYAHAQENP